ncbi:MAG: hypothetical protein IPI93_13405 [Sphingobacteriaceae bacterium]|nr:hypothetical protein [Sphingobacteriaceae bacterium]
MFKVGVDDPLFTFFYLVRAFFIATKNNFKLFGKDAFLKIFYFKNGNAGFIIASSHRQNGSSKNDIVFIAFGFAERGEGALARES